MHFPWGVIRRMFSMVIVILAVVIINFVLIRVAPGDPVSVLAGESGAADPQFIEQLTREFQLDKPLPVQLFKYVRSLASFDLGFSYRQKRPVWDLIEERISATLLLTVCAFVVSLLAGVGLGILAAIFRGKALDSVITTLALVLYATPIFWVGLMLVLVFSVYWPLLPPFGMESIGMGYQGVDRLRDIAAHAVLPVATLSSFYMALYARMMRASMIDVQTADFIKTAKAKGLGRLRVVLVHALRNASLPVVTLAGLQAGQLIGGSILVETVFAWPGIGRLAFDALMQRDYQVLLGVFFCTAVLVVAFNLITDLVYSLVDPRIRSGA